MTPPRGGATVQMLGAAFPASEDSNTSPTLAPASVGLPFSAAACRQSLVCRTATGDSSHVERYGRGAVVRLQQHRGRCHLRLLSSDTYLYEIRRHVDSPAFSATYESGAILRRIDWTFACPLKEAIPPSRPGSTVGAVRRLTVLLRARAASSVAKQPRRARQRRDQLQQRRQRPRARQRKDVGDHLLGGDIDLVLLDCALPYGPNW